MDKFLLFLLIAVPNLANAHVKWFSDYNFQQPPLSLESLNTPVFWMLFALSLLTLPLFIWLDVVGEKSIVYRRMNEFFDRYSDDAPLIMRITMGAVLLMSWQGDSMVAPEIPIPDSNWGWFQFFLILFLLLRETTPLTGLGMIVLYGLAMKQNGLFHMLDYVIYPSVGLYLIFSNLKNETFKNFDLPVLYSGLGFSLCWVAFEKMIYPFWGLSVLSKAPTLTMGLPHDFFLLSCAFIEFSLGYLLIICLLHRPLAAIITLTFFTTTAFFGKMEIIGHTILHGALIVFIVKGPGKHYTAPIRFHQSLLVRNLFAVVNFILLFAVLIYPYQKMASAAYVKARTEGSTAHPVFELNSSTALPAVQIHAQKDEKGGWNLHLKTENFTFLPADPNRADAPHEGHAHLIVDGKKVGRIYGQWYHLNLPSGEHRVKVTLNTNSHKDLAFNGKKIEAEISLSEERDLKAQHAH